MERSENIAHAPSELTLDEMRELRFQDLHAMSPERRNSIPLGMQYLIMLGHSSLIGRGVQTGYAIENEVGVDEPVPIERFYELCEEHVTPIMTKLATDGPKHADTAEGLMIARVLFSRFLSEADQ